MYSSPLKKLPTNNRIELSIRTTQIASFHYEKSRAKNIKSMNQFFKNQSRSNQSIVIDLQNALFAIEYQFHGNLYEIIAASIRQDYIVSTVSSSHSLYFVQNSWNLQIKPLNNSKNIIIVTQIYRVDVRQIYEELRYDLLIIKIKSGTAKECFGYDFKPLPYQQNRINLMRVHKNKQHKRLYIYDSTNKQLIPINIYPFLDMKNNFIMQHSNLPQIKCGSPILQQIQYEFNLIGFYCMRCLVPIEDYHNMLIFNTKILQKIKQSVPIIQEEKVILNYTVRVGKIAHAKLEMLIQSTFKNLTVIDLNSNRIGVKGVMKIVRANWKQITNICLDGNEIDDSCMNYLTKTSWKRLHSFTMINNMLANQGGKQIGKSCWKELTYANLYKNLFNEVGIIQFLKFDWSIISVINLCIQYFSKKNQKVMKMQQNYKDIFVANWASYKNFQSDPLIFFISINILIKTNIQKILKMFKIIIKNPTFILKALSYRYSSTNEMFIKAYKLKQRVTKQEYNKYFEDKLSTFDKESGQLIKQIGKRNPDLTKLHKNFDLYLKDYTKYTNHTLNGILSLLSAINLSGIDSLNKYKFQILQHTNRVILQKEIESLNLNYFILSEADYRKTSKQKMKTSRLLFNIMIAIQNNFDKVEPELYLNILQILCLQQRYQSNLLKIAHLIQRSTSKFISNQLNNQKTDENKIILSDKFICLLSQTYKIYGVDEHQSMQIFYQYITKVYLHRKYTTLDSKLSYINTLYRNFNYQLKNKDGVYYKQLLFNHITTIVFNHKKDIQYFATSKHGCYLCSSIITHKFYQFYQQLRFVQIGSFSYLPKEQIVNKPELPSIFWQIYKINPESLNHISYLENIIKDVYPDRYIKTKGKNLQTIQPLLQTQMKIRVEQALISLNLKYKPEVQISGRYIDFLIEEDIILQIDGIHHFCINSLEMTDKSLTRNVHFLHKGYRMIIINIYQYNIAREMQELRELIRCKLELLLSNNAALLL